MVDHLANKVNFPPKVHFSPGVVMARAQLDED
jgi:hypothetical protein